MNYQHSFVNGEKIHLPVGKVVCVGRNYAEHAKELGNPLPTQPIFFIKAKTAIVPLLEPIQLPPAFHGECHFETEISVLIGQSLSRVSLQEAEQAIMAYGLGLDLTLRDLQTKLKQQGHPWEQAKSFDGACPLSPFVKKSEFKPEQPVTFQHRLNDKLVQNGNSQDMLNSIPELISMMSEFFTLEAGDVVLTGTPAGVAPLTVGDKVELILQEQWRFKTQVMT